MSDTQTAKVNKMKKEWEERAETNAYHWVESTEDMWEKDAYYESGMRDIKKHVLSFFEKKNINADVYSKFSVLDIGCGTGRLCRAFSSVCADVNGLDISEEMINKAQQDNADLINIHFSINSGSDLQEIKSDSIDFCFSYIVFQHILSKKVILNYFKEIQRVVKDGGHVKVQVRGYPGNPPGRVVWFKGFMSFYIAIALWRNILPILWLRKYDSVYGACFTKKELQKRLQKMGFVDVNITRQNDRYLWAEFSKPH